MNVTAPKLDVFVRQTIEYHYVYQLYARYLSASPTPEISYRINVLTRILNYMLVLPNIISYPKTIIATSQLICDILSTSERDISTQVTYSQQPSYHSALNTFCVKMKVFSENYNAKNLNCYLLDLLGMIAAGVNYWLVHRSHLLLSK